MIWKLFLIFLTSVHNWLKGNITSYIDTHLPTNKFLKTGQVSDTSFWSEKRIGKPDLFGKSIKALIALFLLLVELNLKCKQYQKRKQKMKYDLFSLRSQIINILNFYGKYVCISTIQLLCCNTKAVTNSITNKWNKTSLTNINRNFDECQENAIGSFYLDLVFNFAIFLPDFLVPSVPFPWFHQ